MEHGDRQEDSHERYSYSVISHKDEAGYYGRTWYYFECVDEYGYACGD